MAQTTLTIYAGDQLYKSVDLLVAFPFFHYEMPQLLHPANWDIYWTHSWIAGLVHWWVSSLPQALIPPSALALFIQGMAAQTEMRMGRRRALVSSL